MLLMIITAYNYDMETDVSSNYLRKCRRLVVIFLLVKLFFSIYVI